MEGKRPKKDGIGNHENSKRVRFDLLQYVLDESGILNSSDNEEEESGSCDFLQSVLDESGILDSINDEGEDVNSNLLQSVLQDCDIFEDHNNSAGSAVMYETPSTSSGLQGSVLQGKTGEARLCLSSLWP